MLKKFAIGFLALVAILLLIGQLLSQHYESSRTIVIRAPPEKVFAQLGDLRRWAAWNPFEREDPTIVTTFGERTSGVGASQSWTGESGGGKLVLTRWDPERGVSGDMTFYNGENEAPAKTWLEMERLADGSVELEWGINGDMNMPLIGGYLAKLSDRFLGPRFEQGLATIQSLAEAP